MMSSRMYALALVTAVVFGIGLAYALVSAQTRWAEARYTKAALSEAHLAIAQAHAARAAAEAARATIEADYAKCRASIGNLLTIAGR